MKPRTAAVVWTIVGLIVGLVLAKLFISPPEGIGHAGGFVSTPIAFVKGGSTCVSVKEDPVRAHSADSVAWSVAADAGCGFEGKKVEIVFLNAADPGQCDCDDTIANNIATKLRLKVKSHSAHTSYEYEIRVAGVKVVDPKLEVDP